MYLVGMFVLLSIISIVLLSKKKKWEENKRIKKREEMLARADEIITRYNAIK